MQPGLAALLSHNAIRSPGGETIVKALVRRTHCLLSGKRHSGVIKTREIAHPIVGRGGHDPGKAAASERVGEPAVVLEQEQRTGAKRGIHCVPVDGVGKVDVEICDDRLPLPSHVCWRRKIGSFGVLHYVDQSRLGRTTGAGVVLDRTLIDHESKGEAGVLFGLCHDRQCGLVL